MDECKPLNPGDVNGMARVAKAQHNKVKFEKLKEERNSMKVELRHAQAEVESMRAGATAVDGRGLHSSTFQLSLSRL